MHGKYKFNIANELCLHMKSGRSPYKLVGLNSGFVFNWKNNVDLTIDGTIDPKRLVVITSDDFIFAVPNYSVKENIHGAYTTMVVKTWLQAAIQKVRSTTKSHTT